MNHQIIDLSEPLLPTKENIEMLANNIVANVLEGNANPLNVAIQLEAIKKACESAREKIATPVLNELQKFGNKTMLLGAKIEQKEVGTKYDFTQSEAWAKYNKQKEAIAEKLKAIEGIAKNVPLGTESSFTDTDTGETFTIVRASKTSTTSFAITLSK